MIDKKVYVYDFSLMYSNLLFFIISSDFSDNPLFNFYTQPHLHTIMIMKQP